PFEWIGAIGIDLYPTSIPLSQSSQRNLFGGRTANGTAQYAPGKVGQAFSFAGSAPLKVASDCCIQAGTGFTVEFWLQLKKQQPAENFVLLDFASATAATPGWRIDGRQTTGILTFHAGDGTNAAMPQLGTPRPLNDALWHHLAITLDSKQLQLFIDGQAGQKIAYTGSLVTDAKELVIGAAASGMTRVAIAMTLTVTALAQTPPPANEQAAPAKGSISGVVRDAGTGGPIADADLYVSRNTPKEVSAISDSEGS